jgi:hypothetical protein
MAATSRVLSRHNTPCTRLPGCRTREANPSRPITKRQPDSVIVPIARASGQRARICGRLMFDP